jgi:PAS domain S-box-containing protein
MTPAQKNRMLPSEQALYNSKISQTYIDYLRVNYPKIQIDKLLRHAGMSKEEVTDNAHWFTQAQIDRLQEVLVAETGDSHIARHAGRFVASARGLGQIKQYVVGLMNIETVFLSMAKIIPRITKGAAVSIRRLGPGKIEITSTPNPGVDEKIFQCENRIGYFEGLPKLFTDCYATIEHPACFHKGDPCCRYIVSWDKSLSLKLRLMRNYALPISLLITAGSYFFLPAAPVFNMAALLIIFNLVLSKAYDHQRIKEQRQVSEANHKMAEENMESADAIYNNALLIREIGQATASIFDANEMMDKLAELMERRLSFDRALILLADHTEKHLIYSAGYGYSEDEKERLERTVFTLDRPDSRGAFIRTFLDQRHIVVTDFADIEESLSDKDRKLARHFNVKSFMCVPIVFEGKSLGVLAVDNVRTLIPLKKSDVHLLEGIASNIAISINNSRSFQKLRESESRYRQTLESIALGYFELDRTHGIVFVNKAFCELLGYTADELMGLCFDHLFSPDTEDQIEGLLNGIRRDGNTVGFAHFAMVKKEGSSIPVDLSASLVYDTNDLFCGFRGLVRDATDRLKGEKEKELLEKRLIQAQKMEAIGTLAGGIAHNFNNWLNGILGNVTLIRLDPQVNAKTEERVRKIEHIVESAARMTQQLLGYARGGKYKVDLLDINTVIKESADMFSVTKRDIAIHLNLTPSLASVRADKGQIEQVLWNLYVNAVDAMPGGGKMIIETKQTTSGALGEVDYEIASGDYICFSVKDYGVGISPALQKKIFEPFFTTKHGKGTGLGLASVYGIVKSHGGYVDVKSAMGQGSTFSIFLPAAGTPHGAGRHSDLQTIRTGQEKILLVDDEEIILDSCGQMLTKLGYTALTASRGKEALEIYAAQCHTIDLVIIDMIMPGMNGSELFDHLKKVNPNVHVLLSSGYGLNEQVQKILDSGCKGFIQKPYTMVQLSQMIRKVLDKAPSEVARTFQEA